MAESHGFGEPVTRAPGDRERVLAAGERGRVVTGQLLRYAQVIQGVGLAGLVPGLTVLANGVKGGIAGLPAGLRLGW